MKAQGLPYALASELRPGDRVVVRGAERVIVDVERYGKDAPLFTLEGRAEPVSWQDCGMAPPGPFEDRLFAPSEPVPHEPGNVPQFRVWIDIAGRPNGWQCARRWKCVAAFMYLQECLDYIAGCQDAGVDVVYQSPADCRVVRASDRRVVYRPEPQEAHS
jgi:hypothetical protein